MTTLRNVGMTLLAPASAILAALLVTSILISVSGGSATDFLSVIISVPQHRLIVDIVNQTAIIYISALAAAIGFRMNLFNIGVEGQYIVASYGAATLAGAAIFPGALNIVIPLMFAVLLGAAWAGIAGIFKVTRGVSEVISTIMLNAIALTMTGYLLNKYGQHVGNGVRTTPIPSSSHLGGWYPFDKADGPIWTLSLLAVALGIGFWVVLNRTRFGFDLRATGLSQSAAVASGVNVSRMVVYSMLLSGAIAGLIWMPAFYGSAHSYGTSFQAGLGFTGIAVALLGRNQAVGIAFGAVLFAFLNAQANRLTIETNVSVSVVQITQGITVLAVVIAYEVVRRYRIRAEQRAVATREPASLAPEGAPA
jgi:simple sugar transport system permease protein